MSPAASSASGADWMNSESPLFSHGRMLEPLGLKAYDLCLRMNERNSEIISRADAGGTLRVTSGPRCGANFLKISVVGTFLVRLASTQRTSAHSWTASERLRSTVSRSSANDRKQPSRRNVASDETIGVIVTVSLGA